MSKNKSECFGDLQLHIEGITLKIGVCRLKQCEHIYCLYLCLSCADTDCSGYGLLNTTRKVRRDCTHETLMTNSLFHSWCFTWELITRYYIINSICSFMAHSSMWSPQTSRRKCVPTETWTTSWPRQASFWMRQLPRWTRSWDEC